MIGFSKDIIRQKHVRVIFLILSLVVIALTMVWIRVFYASMQAYQDAEVYLKQRQLLKAITFFDRSMHWYAPFNPYMDRSAEQLWNIALWAQQQDDIHLSLIAIRAIRRGFYAARSVYAPGKYWINKCEAKINELLELERNQQGAPRISAGRDNSTPISQGTTSPDTLWSVVVEVGFLGWIGSVIGLIVFTRTGDRTRLLTSHAMIWGSLVAIFFALWIVGMIKA